MGKYIPPAKRSAPFRMGRTPFNPRTGRFLPLGKDEIIVQELTITGKCTEGDNLDDCLVCEDGDGKTVYVVKPFMLQRTPFDDQTIDGITYNYSSAFRRTADNGTETIDQEVTPVYFLDGIESIVAARIPQPSMNVGARKVEWADLNLAGRTWRELTAWTGGTGGIGSGGPISLKKWYHIEADRGWTVIDRRDWGGRWAWINLIHDPGELDEWDDQYAEHWDSIAGAYAFQTTQAHTWFKLMLNSTGLQQEISRVLIDPGVGNEGDFYLRMNTDGQIEMLVENYNNVFAVRFEIRSGAGMPLTDFELID